MKKLLSILALALCFVACQNEPNIGAKNSDLANVVLNIEAPELATRADADANAGKNSAFGAIDFFNDADWANYDVRYILEVYNVNDNGTGEPIYRERLVKCLDKYAPTTFNLRLVPNREYKFVVFADFVEQDSKDDLYYDTTDLNNITAKTGAEGWNAMNEVRDAYFVSQNVKVEASLDETLTLKRPFGKVRVIATDLDYIAGYSKPGYVEITYHTEPLFKSFNAVNGDLNKTQLAGTELTYAYEVKKDAPYTESYDAEAKNQTLFADYLFARENQQMPINFTMAVYESKGGRLIKETDFNTQIPVQRNYLTTITGDILTTQANINILIEDKFDGEMLNPSMESIAAPVVTATVEGNAVTLAWEAVEGAAKYFTRLAAAGNSAEETTELTKVYENLDWETEYTFEVYAVSEKGLVSETTEVKATTDKKPLTYNIYLENKDNWEAVYFYAWSDDYNTAAWPGEAMTKTSVDGVEYYVYNLPVEANGKTINFLFNNGGNGKQTADIKDVVINKDYFYSNYVEVPEVDTILYLEPNANWNIDNARFAAYFFGAGEAWASMTLVEGETNIYAVTVPAGGYTNVIFCRMNPNASANNWNNKWNQTADLNIPTDGTNLYTVKDDTWDNGGGAWSTYAPAVVEPTEPVALATPVVEASVEGNVVTLTWAAVENAAQYGITVGTEMPVFVEETTYVFTGEYETDYTFSVVAVPEDETKFAVSEAAVVTATTEAAPVVEPEELIALDAASYYLFKPANEIKGGKWYAIVYENKAATGLTGNYGYLKVTEAEARANGISLPASCAFGFLTTNDGYTIQQLDSKYVYQTGSYDSLNVSATIPADGGIWSVAVEGNEFTITNNAMNKYVQYDSAYNSYGCYATNKGSLPTLYELVEIDNTPIILGVSPSSLNFDAEGNSKTATINTYGTATINVSDNADWVSTSVNNNVVTVTTDANSGAAREAIVTITYGDDSATIAVSQAEYQDPSVTPETPENTLGVYTSMDFLFDGKTLSSDKLSPGTNAYKQKMNYEDGTIDILKLGTSSKAGSYETAAVGVSGKSKLSFYAVGWKGKTVKLTVTVDGKATELTLKANNGATGNPPYNNATAALEFNDETDYYTIDVTGITVDSTVSFATDNSGYRAIICGVQLY